MDKAIDFILMSLIACVVVIMSFFLCGPAWMNADTPLLTVMSLQKLTLFIWGQNRFLNIVPAVASPIRDPTFNLAVQLSLFGGGFVGLLALIGSVVSCGLSSRACRIDKWLCFSVVLLVFLAVTSRYGIYVFIPEGQPYGLSCLLVGFGLRLIVRSAPSGWVGWTVASIMMLIGGGLNPSLLLVADSICGFVFLYKPELRSRTVAAFMVATSAIGVWLIVARFEPGPRGYGTFTYNHVILNLDRAATFLKSGFVGTSLVWLALLDVAICVVLVVRSRWNSLAGQTGWMPPAAALVFMLAWVVAFSQNKWVIENAYHFRYFYPVFLVVPVVLSLPILAVLVLLPRQARISSAVSSFVLSACILVAPWRPLDAFPVFAKVAAAVGVARSQNIHFVSGSYWTVWPAVFLLLSRDGVAFGLEHERAAANAAAAIAELHGLQAAQIQPRSLCLDEQPRSCTDVAGQITGERWKPIPGDCGHDCSMIETVNGRDADPPGK